MSVKITINTVAKFSQESRLSLKMRPSCPMTQNHTSSVMMMIMIVMIMMMVVVVVVMMMTHPFLYDP